MRKFSKYVLPPILAASVVFGARTLSDGNSSASPPSASEPAALTISAESPAPMASLAAFEVSLYSQSVDLSFLPKTGSQYCLYVDMASYRAHLFEQKTDSAGAPAISELASGIIACGKPGTSSPLNITVAARTIILYPWWWPTDKTIALARKKGQIKRTQRPDTPTRPNPANPLGRVKIPIVDYPSPYRVHGTNQPELLVPNGANPSSGCIRSDNSFIEHVADTLSQLIGHRRANFGAGQINLILEQPLFVRLNYEPIREVRVIFGQPGAPDTLAIVRSKDVFSKAHVQGKALFEQLSSQARSAGFVVPKELHSAALDSLRKRRMQREEFKIPFKIQRAASANNSVVQRNCQQKPIR